VGLEFFQKFYWDHNFPDIKEECDAISTVISSHIYLYHKQEIAELIWGKNETFSI
jgi:hypothetical protein